ncbi:protein POOR HOMOLOGOUS SYNAPSIS 1 isoform X2 [Phoenix dactylifera]|uniref:Protein POOR HOMOLOGOUS SYNAPSIS 1 isoform X2 n=1 Tax=Phoenix dactylifera TaxID=42345 RepID=A0A8B9A8F8_PHODC|nr:protein POOR HOMOLOGOUS SYNAPSIS 1 isoform X2 [Phoenix dactylifera]
MAGALGFSPAVPSAGVLVVAEQWEVEFSRFFNFPRRPSLLPPGLRPLPKGKLRSNGTWITSASPALLRVLKSHASAAPVLSVSVNGNVHIQKFAVRFPACCDAEKFLNFVKECSRDIMDIMPPGSDFVCENSSPSEFIASNGLHYRFDGESSFEEPVMTCAPEMPALSYNEEQTECSLRPVVANNIDTIFSGLPPSFTELLTNCSTDTEKVQKLTANTDPASQNGGYPLDPSSHGIADAAKQPNSMEVEETDLKTQIAKYMSDASFHEMLFKLEKVIDELGGDLALQVASPLHD